jgi:hypothetical protein
MSLDLVNCFWILTHLSKYQEYSQENWNRTGEVLAKFSQISISLWCTRLFGGVPDCSVVHRTMSGAQAGPTMNSSLSEKSEGTSAKIHRTVWCAPDCTVSQRHPRPTVGSAISGRRMARANGQLDTPDYPVCTGQCPVRQRDRRSNGRLCPIRKEIGHRTTIVHVRWCTGLSGAPPDRRQELPSNWISNGS